ncbi:hypothetical protein LguiA_003857 [Lonicera macranthoides]
MAQAMVLIWACSVLLVMTNLVEGIGVNWGTQMSQNLHPSVVVQMLKDNKINKVKLFSADHWTVKYFAGTGIEVMLGIPNVELSKFADDYDHAEKWVKENVTTHLHDGGVNIRYVAVGNEPFLKSYKGANLKTTFPALKNIQKALNAAGLGDKIKATIPQNADVYSSDTGGPSHGNFRSEIRDLMVQIVRFLHENKAPFLVNIYPFLSLYENKHFPVEFAFFDGNAKPVQDNNVQYHNMFDANLDTLVWSLKKAGVPDVKVVVGEIGWPTDGDPYANATMAKKFYDGFFKKMASKKGTPLHPSDIDVYLFSLTDENLKSIEPGDFERHWGIFRYDGQPKFPMDVTGNGNDKMPVGAKNIQYQEHQWCIMNPDIKNMTLVISNMEYACARTDCTSLKYGACNKLDEAGKASYAFNMYFQTMNQDVEACVFQDLAKISNKNASTSGCLFPIAIMSGGGRTELTIVTSVFAGLLALFALF